MTPTTVDELIAGLRDAGGSDRTLTPVGGGTRSRRGRVVPAGDTLSTAHLDAIVEHTPAELTATVEAGVPATLLAERLGDAGQWWPQADVRPGSTVGGILAAAASGRRRLRYGPVRDSLLEVVMVTGDGRLVKGGGRTVKGVAGYDLPRLAVGSFGTLGVIVQVTLKLTPLPQARRNFTLAGSLEERLAAAARVMRDVWRPAAVLLAPGRLSVDIAGAIEDVVAPDGFIADEPPPEPAGTGLVDVGVPPTRLGALVGHVEAAGFPYVAECGVGTCRVAVETAEDLAHLRAEAVTLGGHAVVVDGPDELRRDPWGPDPAGHAIIRRLQQAFDPHAVLSPAHRMTAP